MKITKELDEFRREIDNDGGLASKRRFLILASLVLLALNVSGAQIQEANTFLFKLTFENHEGLIYLLAASIIYLMFRYYAYAHVYHVRLFDFWSQRMMSDYQLFRNEYEEYEIGGLLGKKVRGNTQAEPEITSCKYYVGLPFVRKLYYYTEENHYESGHCESVIHFYDLNKFDKYWKFPDYLKLLSFEFRYQMGSFFKYREALDLLAPYMIALISLGTIYWVPT